jgi:hypothetical protein
MRNLILPVCGHQRSLCQVFLRKHWDDAVYRALEMDHGDFIVSHRPTTKQLGLVVVDEKSTYVELDPIASARRCTRNFIDNALNCAVRRDGAPRTRVIVTRCQTVAEAILTSVMSTNGLDVQHIVAGTSRETGSDQQRCDHRWRNVALHIAK